MNIAYILSATISNGGATKAFINMLDGLFVYGIHPFVIVPDGNGITQELISRNIPTIVINYRPSTYPNSHTLKGKVLFFPKLIARIIVNRLATKTLEGHLKNDNIDIVHSNTGIIRIGFDAARKVGIPHIYHIREYGDLDFGIYYYPRKQSFYNQLGALHCYSICITKDIQRYHRQQGVTTSRVIYDGVFKSLEAKPIVHAKDYFLFAGRIQPAKGLDQLLLAYKRYTELNGHPLPLKVAGSITDEVYYQQQIHYITTHKLSEKVQFLGECNDITCLMQQARALIIPSRNEGFGFCMPEAMQQGCLCVAHNTGGSKEQLDLAHEMTGREIALRYDTTEQLAELLSEITDNPVSHYEDYTQSAFKVVNKLYTREKNAEAIYELYKYILNDTNH